MPALLSAAQRAKVIRLSAREAPAAEEDGELNIVPMLDIIMNVMLFVLATLAVTFTGTVDVAAAPARPGRDAPAGLTILAVEGGVALKASGGNVAQGCRGLGPGLAVPKRADAYDYEALGACAARLKHEVQGLEHTRQITVSANPGIPYQAIIRAVDSVRSEQGGAPLFDEVSLGVPR